MIAASVFIAQFIYIMLLGLQQLNVVGKHYVAAQTVSLMLGVFGFHLMATIARHADESLGTLVWWSYIAAGPIGITCSMWLHPRIKRFFGKRKETP